jgi:REP element-mobilizing transposase RayT
MLGVALEYGLFIYRRNLPHWRLDGSCYYVTFRLHPAQAPLTPEERTLIASAIKHFDGQRLKLCAYVVMDDHCHMIVKPFDGWRLDQLMHSIRSFTANQLHKTTRNGSGQVWQREYYDRIIRDEEEFWEKIYYIVTNPQRRWPSVTEYAWAEWFRF